MSETRPFPILNIFQNELLKMLGLLKYWILCPVPTRSSFLSPVLANARIRMIQISGVIQVDRPFPHGDLPPQDDVDVRSTEISPISLKEKYALSQQ